MVFKEDADSFRTLAIQRGLTLIHWDVPWMLSGRPFHAPTNVVQRNTSRERRKRSGSSRRQLCGTHQRGPAQMAILMRREVQHASRRSSFQAALLLELLGKTYLWLDLA